MLRWTGFLSLALVAALPLLGSQGDGKDKPDPLIAAMKFVKVPKGTFWMGWDSVKKESKQVEIKEDFELAAYTVTQEQWQAIMGNNPSWYSRQGGGKDQVKDIADADLKRFPVETVSPNEVREFLKKLNDKEKGKGWVYRLPTELEWEYACRGAATTKEECSFDFYLDKPTNDLSSKQANVGFITLQRPTKVGSYAPNKLGLYDMHGNVWQLCTDGASGVAVRGGCFFNGERDCRAAKWFIGDDKKGTARSEGSGFRLARVPSGK